MKEWIKKWLGIYEEIGYLNAKDLDLWNRVKDLEQAPTKCLTAGEEIPRGSVLLEVVERLGAIIEYLDIEFYHEQKPDPRYSRPIPRMIEELKARKKKHTEKLH